MKKVNVQKIREGANKVGNFALDEVQENIQEELAVAAADAVAANAGRAIAKQIGERNLARGGLRVAGKSGVKLLSKLGRAAPSLGAAALVEAFDSDPLGAVDKSSYDYWHERGVRDPEEIRNRISHNEFFKDKPKNIYKEKYNPRIHGPELKSKFDYQAAVDKAKKEGTLRDNYVEDIPLQNRPSYQNLRRMLSTDLNPKK